MKKYIWIVAVVLALIGGVWLLASKSTVSSDDSDTLTFATIENEVKTSDTVLYDVRTEEEYAAGHMSGAKLHDNQDIQQGIYPDEPKDKKIYLYCRSGNRSAQAAKSLEEAGFTSIIDLGGLNDVQSIGGKLVS